MVLHLTTENGQDPIDGSELNAVRRRALELLERDDDDLTDAEVFASEATDQFWFISLCVDQLHRLPSEVDPLLLCREYTLLQAHAVVRKAMSDMTKIFSQR